MACVCDCVCMCVCVYEVSVIVFDWKAERYFLIKILDKAIIMMWSREMYIKILQAFQNISVKSCYNGEPIYSRIV